MKRVYFVRHGETVANVEDIVQGLDDPLTAEGERQILRIAERAANIEFGALISSDAIRTQQTAGAISKVKGMDIELSPLFREARRPTSLIGVRWETEAYKELLRQEREHWGEPGWRYEDGENYEDLVTRARDAIAYIEAHSQDTLMVVTHGKFLKCMLAYLAFGEEITPQTLRRIDELFRTTNTGVTHCYQDDSGWRVLTWNDHAHFAE
jgi:broad specificity phosphatase PhoE